jgi:predicted outer membrane repeat protein
MMVEPCRSTFSDNDADANGGAIQNFGTLTVEDNVLIEDNTAGEDGGGIYTYDELIVTDSELSGNVANDDGGGIRNGSSSVTLSGVVISDCRLDPNNQQLSQRPGVGSRVMGEFPSGATQLERNDWLRGQRGWGSSTTGIFQQNVVVIVDMNGTADESKEVDETAADMFLNWVYRRLVGQSQTSNVPDSACTGPAMLGNWGGFLNADANGMYDSSLPGNARYWWMETQLRVLLTPWL